MIRVWTDGETRPLIMLSVSQNIGSLEHEVQWKSIENIETLLKSGCDINELFDLGKYGEYSEYDKNGMTALHIAVKSKRSEDVIDLLIKYGANVMIRNNAGDYPIRNKMCHLLPKLLPIDYINDNLAGRSSIWGLVVYSLYCLHILRGALIHLHTCYNMEQTSL